MTTKTEMHLLDQLIQSAKHNQTLKYEKPEDLAITAKRIEENLAAFGHEPEVGQWVETPEGLKRIGYIWDRNGNYLDIQFSNGSYYLCKGSCDMGNGSLESTVKLELESTDRTVLADCWIFHLHSGASRGLYFSVPMKVWKIAE